MDNPLPQPTNSEHKRRSLWTGALILIAAVASIYLIVAYLVMPIFWDRYEQRHPALEGLPNITETAN